MDPHTGDVFRMRQELVDAEIGDKLDMDKLRARLAELGTEATAEEALAIRAEQLVAVSEQAMTKLKLGERERERRKRRRQAEKRARRGNRP